MKIIIRNDSKEFLSGFNFVLEDSKSEPNQPEWSNWRAVVFDMESETWKRNFKFIIDLLSDRKIEFTVKTVNFT